MGHCNECGAPCPYCSRREDFSLATLDPSIREGVKRLLDELGVTTAQREVEIVSKIAQYPPKVIKRALRIWRAGSYAMAGKDENYFLGIVRRRAVERPGPRLEGLPPEVIDE